MKINPSGFLPAIEWRARVESANVTNPDAQHDVRSALSIISGLWGFAQEEGWKEEWVQMYHRQERRLRELLGFANNDTQGT